MALTYLSKEVGLQEALDQVESGHVKAESDMGSLWAKEVEEAMVSCSQ